jgi:hypothetical protein
MGYTHYINNLAALTVEQLNHAVEVINAFLSTVPDVLLFTSNEDVDKFYSSQCAFFDVKEDPELYNRLMGHGVPRDYHIDASPVTLYKLRKIINGAYSTGKRESDVIFVDHNKMTGRVCYYIGHPSGLSMSDEDYSHEYCVEININNMGFDCFKTGRDPRSDKIFASVYGVFAAMFPGRFDYSNDENYSAILKSIAERIPAFVAAFEGDKQAEEMKVGGKAKRVKGAKGAVGGRRSDRLRLA